MPSPFPVLILGGTGEAMQLAQCLKDHSAFAPLMSFAGRTRDLRLPPIPHRVGGFGGAHGLAAYLREGGFAAVVDATHPFAARMSDNAVAACAEARVPLAVFTRPAWTRQTGDTWIEVDDAASAAAALGGTPRTVFLAIGRQDLGAFRGGVAHRYVVRAVDAPDADALPHGARVIAARGPFAADEELALLRHEEIDVVVSKNSGGSATYGKIAAARQLGLPVVMLKRPRSGAGGELHKVEAVMAWLDVLRRQADSAARGASHDTAP